MDEDISDLGSVVYPFLIPLPDHCVRNKYAVFFWRVIQRLNDIRRWINWLYTLSRMFGYWLIIWSHWEFSAAYTTEVTFHPYCVLSVTQWPWILCFPPTCGSVWSSLLEFIRSQKHWTACPWRLWVIRFYRFILPSHVCIIPYFLRFPSQSAHR